MIFLAKVTALLAVDYSSANHNKKEGEPLLSSGESLHILDHSNTTTVRKSGTGYTVTGRATGRNQNKCRNRRDDVCMTYH